MVYKGGVSNDSPFVFVIDSGSSRQVALRISGDRAYVLLIFMFMSVWANGPFWLALQKLVLVFCS